MQGHQTHNVPLQRNDKTLRELEEVSTNQGRLDLIRAVCLCPFGDQFQQGLISLQMRLVRRVDARFAFGHFTRARLVGFTGPYLQPCAACTQPIGIQSNTLDKGKVCGKVKRIGLHMGLSLPMRMMCGQCCSALAKNGLVTPNKTEGGGSDDRPVYSLNSESWIVKNGR